MLRQAQHKSKKKLDCSLIRAERPDAFLRKVVPNTPEGVATLLNWVKNKAKCDDIGAFHAVLEATGPYHEIAAQTLFDAACKVSVVNPAYTNASTSSAQEVSPKVLA